MKFSFFIDKDHDEEVIVYSHEESELINEIRSLVASKQTTLYGYTENEVIVINPSETECFIIEDNKVYAQSGNGKLRVKERLYQLEEILPDHFIKINQSCLCNIRKIQKFDVSFSGSLRVIFKSGYCDYVSRRNVKNVKERLGL
jgi:DNA-binding LytR/AlgR family response regulator